MIEFIEDKHIYLVDGVVLPSVSKIMSLLSNQYYEDIDQEILNKACERGSAIHKATEMIDKGKEYEIQDNWKDYVLQYKKFLALRKPIIEQIEIMKTDGRCCGTIDRIIKLGNEKWLIDIKTSSKINYELVSVQLGAYKILTKDERIDKYGVLHLTKTGYKFEEIKPREDIFNALYTIWEYIENMKGKI